MKSNVQQTTALNAVSDALNNCEFLFTFDIETLPQRTELHIETDSQEVSYSTDHVKKMYSFLQKLKDRSPEHSDDIEELIEELHA